MNSLDYDHYPTSYGYDTEIGNLLINLESPGRFFEFP